MSRLEALRQALIDAAGDPGATITVCRGCKQPEGQVDGDCLRCHRIRGDDPRSAVQIMADIEEEEGARAH